MASETDIYYYDKFIEQLDYDKEYARRMYPEWHFIVKSIYQYNTREFFLRPLTPPALYSFLEFIDGNGFAVERTEEGPEEIYIRIYEFFRWE